LNTEKQWQRNILVQKALIIDIDGTLAHTVHAELFKKQDGSIDWEAWAHSTQFASPHSWCLNLVKQYESAGYKLIFITARFAHMENMTHQWLSRYITSDYLLFMRPEGDHREDFIIKQDLYYRNIVAQYEVDFAIDDKQSVIEMWRNLNIPALHCADR